MELDADVIALQEVETLSRAPAGQIGLLEQLQRAGYEPLLGTTMRSEFSSYGNLLLSRLPVRAHRAHQLSWQGREPRGLIEARIEAPAGAVVGPASDGLGDFWCLATHLGLSIAERRWQFARLVEYIDERLQRPPEGGALVLMGDFNEWWCRSRRLRAIDARLEPVPARATFPSGWPLLALDRLWFGGRLRLQDSAVIRTRLTSVASDHLPLRATLRLEAPPATSRTTASEGTAAPIRRSLRLRGTEKLSSCSNHPPSRTSDPRRPSTLGAFAPATRNARELAPTARGRRAGSPPR